jgi:hypothetical protein
LAKALNGREGIIDVICARSRSSGSLSNRGVDRATNPGAHRHAVGLSELSNGLDRRGWESDGNVLRQGALGMSARRARRRFPPLGIVIKGEGLSVWIFHRRRESSS